MKKYTIDNGMGKIAVVEQLAENVWKATLHIANNGMGSPMTFDTFGSEGKARYWAEAMTRGRDPYCPLTKADAKKEGWWRKEAV